LIAGSASGADFEQCSSDAEALADRESVDVEAFVVMFSRMIPG